MEILCAQCRQPFEVGTFTRLCPHCGSPRAATCRDCNTPIYLGATTCVRHSDAGPTLYGDTVPVGDGPADANPGGGPDDGPPLDLGPLVPSPPPPPMPPPRIRRTSGDLGGGPGTGPDPFPSSPPPVPSPRRRHRRWPALVAAVAVAGAAGAGGYVVLNRDPYPKKWDARVAELVSFVERERGLEFKHPVKVEFLSEAEFRSREKLEDEFTKEDEAQLERFEGMLRAVGFLSGDVDLVSAVKGIVDEGTLGFYELEKERIAVKGETLDLSRRATLVHELTHALQDQHFDIDRDIEEAGESVAFQSLVEADAELVQDAWEESLSDDDQQALAEQEDEDIENVDYSKFPPVLVELFGSPYVLGPPFLQAIIDERGESGRDRAFRNPPTTEEHIVLPETYLDDEEAVAVPTPALQPGETLVEDSESSFGMVSLVVLLSERIDFSEAWPAVQGWAGDAMVAFERAGVTCVRVAVQFDEPAQAVRFQQAFTAWGQGLPVTSAIDGDRLARLESCDPGPGQPGRAEGQVSGLEGLAIRQAFVEQMLAQGFPGETAQCFADGVLDRIGANQLASLDQEVTEGDNEAVARDLFQTGAEVAAACQGSG